MESKTISIWVFAFCLAAIVPSLRAHISNFAEADEYWKAKEEDAKLHALNAYHNDPEDVTDHLNLNVHLALEGMNSTRRELGKRYTGRCIATNPIDRCWRCRRDWAQNRKQLANCALGFGRNTTGGARGRYYVVYDPSDNDMVNPRPGTLRHAVIQKQPLWIIFARSMVITLQQELMINNDKTIDGRGAAIRITRGAGLTIQFVKNVIVHNIHISDIVPRNGGLIRDSPDHFGFRTASDGDGISVFGSSRVWLDHLSMRSCSDGLIDVVAGSTAVTISNGHYTHHNDVMLFGASNKTDEDKIMQVTVAFNHFGKGLIQRMPRCRWGYFHVVNNDYTHYLLYAIGGSDQPTIISQGNRFIAPNNEYKQVTKRDYAEPWRWITWVWRTEGDLFMNGAFFVPSGLFDTRRPSRKFIIKPKLATNVNIITRFAGTISCRPNRPC